MARSLMLVPTGAGVGVKTCTLGMEQFLANHGLITAVFQPIYQKSCGYKPKYSISLETASRYYAKGQIDVLLEKVIANYIKLANKCDIVVIQGLQTEHYNQYTQQINKKLALALNAELIIVSAPGGGTYKEMNSNIDNTVRFFSNRGSNNIVGCIINKITTPLNLINSVSDKKPISRLGLKIPLLGKIPWHSDMLRPRVKDIVPHLKARIINPGNIDEARISGVTLCARSIDNVLSALSPGKLIITAGDRSDIILATAMAVANGCRVSGLLLTGGYEPNPSVLELCSSALTDLTILLTDHDSFTTTEMMQSLDMHIQHDDLQQQKFAADYCAKFISDKWFRSYLEEKVITRLTPAAFFYQLSQRAGKNLQKILLPEATDPRIVEAAILAAKRNLALPVLLGNSEAIHLMAHNLGYQLPKSIKIINPDEEREKYIELLVRLRKNKGMTREFAEEQIMDDIVLATLMLHDGKVDGLVAGAINTTANTIRPALQLIKTKPGVEVVSSLFFMCMPQQVMVFGDCAINLNPTAEQLATIAIECSESAEQFGIEPKVAMLSYATGDSGSGVDVTKVIEATKIVQSASKKYVIDGPLQYDAAINPDVAKKKAPDSPVAGQATVCIFPDLNTGNTTYKAVQRSANVTCIGPMLQGLNKPVNDLSRGAKVDDIIFTIVITAIQAQK